jgi:putative hemin transport protein
MGTTTLTTLKGLWEKFKAENPTVRIRDAAKALNTSEAQLLATQVGESVTFLNGDFKGLLKEITSLGYVMALTRNDHIVHERKGVYQNISFKGDTGLVLGEDIDLRLFMQEWNIGFAVVEGNRQSLQFFDKSGSAVHKIYLTERSNMEAYRTLVKKYTAAVQTDEMEVQPYPEEQGEQEDANIDVEGFRAAWKNLKDTHAFFGMLKTFNVSRVQAMRLAPAGFVRQISNEAARKMLQIASQTQTEIMVFAGNRGCIQIHTGTVTKLLESGPWYNVLDPHFNLHLREDKIVSSWIVKKPTEDGDVNSLELFDDKGNNIALFFGKRKPGVPESEMWRKVLASLE